MQNIMKNDKVAFEDLFKALWIAKNVMDYCGGDAWERLCTKSERCEFAKIYNDFADTDFFNELVKKWSHSEEEY